MVLAMSATPDPVSVDLRIDALVLEGFPSRHRHAIGDAVRSELERLIVERGTPAAFRTPSAVAHLGGTFEYAADDAPATIGRRIAAALYDGFVS